MPLPYQFRDYPLLVLMAMAATGFGLQYYLNGSAQDVEIALGNPCCRTLSCAAVEALAAVPQVNRVRHEGTPQDPVIRLTTDRNVSASQLWDIIERVHGEPKSLIVDRQRFDRRPAN